MKSHPDLKVIANNLDRKSVFQIPYNAVGVILKPLLIHSGQIVDKVKEHFAPNLGFINTETGKVDYDTPV